MSTETADPRYTAIDRWPAKSAVEAMLEGQLAAVAALKSQGAAIAAAADAAARRLGDHGRLIYAGAGTSGRVAVQDGVELYPTYNWPRERLLFLMAGGTRALIESAEGAEDDPVAAREAVAAASLTHEEVVIAGLMVNMRVSNAKLRARAERMITTIAGVGPEAARDALSVGGDDVRRAVLVARGATAADAAALLARHGGNLSDAMEAMRG